MIFQTASYRTLSRPSEMVSLQDYTGREQSYVKHVFLESYLERLVHKTASTFQHIVYVDGFAGPWQSANERFEDTSFGIALNALRRAKATWQSQHRDVQMSALLVERDPTAYQHLAQISPRYPDIDVRTYNEDFLIALPTIMKAIPARTFTFFFIDPKGWRIRLHDLASLISRLQSEVIFNFMFDFINRAAGIKDPAVVSGLDDLIPFGDWRRRLEEAENSGSITPDDRKAILVEAFAASLKRIGKYEYVAETTVLRPLTDRPLYCLFYATRHPKGIEVFRDSQIAALHEESKTRAATRVRHIATTTGQGELFESLHDMAPAKLESFLSEQAIQAERALLEFAPKNPQSSVYETVRAQVLAKQVIKVADVNKISARLYRAKQLLFPDWEKGRRVPQPGYRVQRP